MTAGFEPGAFEPADLEPADLEPPAPPPEPLPVARPAQCMRDNRVPDGRLPDGRKINTRGLDDAELALLARVDEVLDDVPEGEPVHPGAVVRGPYLDRTLRRLVGRGLVSVDDAGALGITPGGDRVLQRRRG